MAATQNPSRTWPQLADLPQAWDLIVVGGGITGAGVLLAAVRAGLRALLLESRDFAWGTSSRSSKLVHGGLRYLRQGRLGLTRAAVAERENLMAQAPGLVEPLEFLVPLYRERPPGRLAMRIGLNLYDLIAGRRTHRFMDRATLGRTLPWLRDGGLTGACGFQDAQTDDARLVLRILQEARDLGAAALHYTAVEGIERDRWGRIAAVAARDSDTGASRRFTARAVVNATGAWARRLHPAPGKGGRLRPLRGSHLVLPAARLPLPLAVSFGHPRDGRGVFVLPWHGVVLAGTTDLDHDQDLDLEPRATPAEIHYLLEAVGYIAPGARIRAEDLIGTQAGVRPVVAGRSRRAPSDESREHAVWVDNGLVTVTGGKLTTFRRLAADALAAAAPWLPARATRGRPPALFDPVPGSAALGLDLAPAARRRLAGRYGRHLGRLLARADPATLAPVAGTAILWAELVHAAGDEGVRHLDDLLLRRVRLGLILPGAGQVHLQRIRRLCQPVLGWDDGRWEAEELAYRERFGHTAARAPVQRGR